MEGGGQRTLALAASPSLSPEETCWGKVAGDERMQADQWGPTGQFSQLLCILQTSHCQVATQSQAEDPPSAPGSLATPRSPGPALQQQEGGCLPW